MNVKECDNKESETVPNIKDLIKVTSDPEEPKIVPFWSDGENIQKNQCDECHNEEMAKSIKVALGKDS